MPLPFVAGKCICGCNRRTRKQNDNGCFDHRVAKVSKGCRLRKRTVASILNGCRLQSSPVKRSVRGPPASTEGLPEMTPPSPEGTEASTEAPSPAPAPATLTPRSRVLVKLAVDTIPDYVKLKLTLTRGGGDAHATYCADLTTWIEKFRREVVQCHVGVGVSYIWAATAVIMAEYVQWQSQFDSGPFTSSPTSQRATVVALCVHAMKSEFIDDNASHQDLISALAGAAVDKHTFRKVSCQLLAFTAPYDVPGSKSLLVKK
jgi:hypothetical protein